MRGKFRGEEADGLIPRFQVAVYPDPPASFVNVDEYPDVESKNKAYAAFRGIDTRDTECRGCERDDDFDIPFVRFAADAQEFFDRWRQDLEGRLLGDTLTDVIAAHLAKFRSLMPSLALIFHLAQSHALPSLNGVPLWAARLAAAWCDLLEAHAMRIYQAAREGHIDGAAGLAERIKKSLDNPFTYRQVAQKGWSGLQSVEEVRQAVGVLEDRGWVKVVDVPTTSRGGRPTEQVWINPAVRREQGVSA
jgi:hypothetical protein